MKILPRTLVVVLGFAMVGSGAALSACSGSSGGGTETDSGGSSGSSSGSSDSGSSSGGSSSSGSGSSGSTSSSGSSSGSGSGSSGSTDGGSSGSDSGGDAGALTILVAPGGQHVFSPSTLTVKVGDTVTWEWQAAGHTVTSGASCTPDNMFCDPANKNCATAPLEPKGTKYTHKFTTAGTYPYFCRPHCMMGMTGTITVQ